MVLEQNDKKERKSVSSSSTGGFCGTLKFMDLLTRGILDTHLRGTIREQERKIFKSE